ncbi:hypothetical protein N7451_000971 [Penicillium sp. IBT 35674x]|nr:hypothetical protein N7451_000971 [Penicillium sp. IBT 35674x]
MVKYDMAMRTLVISMELVGMDPQHISALTEMPVRTINSIWDRATERGFDPLRRPFMNCEAHVVDAPRSGRPKKERPEVLA